MSSLTDKRKKEIETQYREMKQKRAYKVFLYIICDIKNLVVDGPPISKRILDSINKINGIESSYYTFGTNVITVVAQWKESEVLYKVEEIRKIPTVIRVHTKILAPLF